jgi:hypothetical protein
MIEVKMQTEKAREMVLGFLEHRLGVESDTYSKDELQGFVDLACFKYSNLYDIAQDAYIQALMARAAVEAANHESLPGAAHMFLELARLELSRKSLVE